MSCNPRCQVSGPDFKKSVSANLLQKDFWARSHVKCCMLFNQFDDICVKVQVRHSNVAIRVLNSHPQPCCFRLHADLLLHSDTTLTSSGHGCGHGSITLLDENATKLHRALNPPLLATINAKMTFWQRQSPLELDICSWHAHFVADLGWKKLAFNDKGFLKSQDSTHEYHKQSNNRTTTAVSMILNSVCSYATATVIEKWANYEQVPKSTDTIYWLWTYNFQWSIHMDIKSLWFTHVELIVVLEWNGRASLCCRLTGVCINFGYKLKRSNWLWKGLWIWTLLCHPWR